MKETVKKSIRVENELYFLLDSVPADGNDYHYTNGHFYGPRKEETIFNIMDRVKGHVLNEEVRCLHSQTAKLKSIQYAFSVEKELNGKWSPDWSNKDSIKYSFGIDPLGEVYITQSTERRSSIVYFKNQKSVKKAIHILGKARIRLIVD